MLSLYKDRIRTGTFRNRPTFSRQPLKNSRFLETRLGDWRIKPLRGGGGSDVYFGNVNCSNEFARQSQDRGASRLSPPAHGLLR